VGIYASRLAAAGPDEVSPRLALEGGAAHDIGKLDIPNAVLRADPFGTEQRRVTAGHALAGFERLRDTHRNVAIIAGLHHAFQHNPYGLQPGTVRNRELVRTAEMVSVCDFFDAFVTRHNCYTQGHQRGLLRQVMADTFPQHPGWVAWLIDHGPVS
jgi:response regulator RpfG family c-di-GMP phosphodiesterase